MSTLETPWYHSPNLTRYLVLASTLIIAYCSRLSLLMQTSYGLGLDAYYYGVQIKSLVERGVLDMVDSSPILYLMSLPGLFCSDYIGVAKQMSALFSALLPLTIYLYLHKKYACPALSMAGMVLAALSPTLAYISVNYIKSIGALGLYFLFLYLALYPKTLHRLLILVLVGAAAFLAHRIVAVIMVVTLVGWILQRWSVRLRLVLAALGALGLGMMLVSFIFKGAIQFADLTRFEAALAFGPVLPVLAPQLHSALPLAMLIEISVYMVASYGLILYLLLRGRLSVQLLLLGLLMFFPFWNYRVDGIGVRIITAAIPFGIMLVIEGVATLTGTPQPARPVRWSRVSQWGTVDTRCASGAIALLGTMVVLVAANLYNARIFTQADSLPYEQYAKVIKPINLPADNLLIAHQGLSTFYTYHKDLRECLSFVPEFTLPPEKVWRIAYGLSPDAMVYDLRQAFQHGQIMPLYGFYTLIREDVWQGYLQSLGPECIHFDTWYNPYQMRPDFLQNKARERIEARVRGQ